MNPKTQAYLYDILTSANRIESQIENKTFDDYRQDENLRDIVERQFIKIGDAITHLRSEDRETVVKITSQQQITDFRNRITHDYQTIDDEIVWDVSRNHLPILAYEVDALLESSADSGQQR